MPDSTIEAVDPSDEMADPQRAETNAPRACTLCGRSFRPEKVNQTYCTRRCRRRSLAVRTKAAKLAAVVTLQPPLSIAVTVRQINRARKAAGQRPAERCSYLQAHAELVEAREQLQRWQKLCAERAAKLQSLPQPSLRAQLVVIRPGDKFVADPKASRYGVAATDSGLGVLALGFEV